MKKPGILFLFLLSYSVAIYAQDNEKTAIIKLMEEEHKYIQARDYQKFAACFYQSENFLWGNGLNLSQKGWGAFSKMVIDMIQKDPEPKEPMIYFNYDIWVAGDRAWVVFEKRPKGSDKAISKEQRTLIKVDGEWKIATLLFLHF